MKDYANELLARSRGKVLQVAIGGRIFGIPICESREVIGMTEIQPLPKTEEYLLGIINLRGQIIPVIDLGQKMGLGHNTNSRENCIVILEHLQKPYGAKVESLIGVLTLEENEYEENPDFGVNLSHPMIAGIGYQDGRMIPILNIEEIFANNLAYEQIPLIAEPAHAA